MYKISQKRIPQFKTKQIRQISGNNNICGSFIRIYREYFALLQVIAKERPVIIRIHPFQYNSLKIVIGLHNPHLRGKSLHMANPGKCMKRLKQRIAYRYRCRLVRTIIIKVSDLDMRTKPDHLITDFLLKTNYDRYRKNHHSQPECNTDYGNTHSRRCDLTITLFAKMNSLRYK